jgi:hypothetical protein
MALPTISFNFKEFMNLSNLIPFLNYVSRWKNLDEGELCAFIQEIDRKEYEILQTENIKIKKLTEN